MASDYWQSIPREQLMSIGVYSLDNVLANLAVLGYHQAQIDAVRRNWIAFKAAQMACWLADEPIEGVVAMSAYRERKAWEESSWQC